MITILSIAGFDPSNGAGVQADLKVFNNFKIHGLSVVTCIVSQNSKNVSNIFKIPVEVIEDQIDTIMDDFNPDFVKIGLLYDEEIIKTVSRKIKEYNFKAIVDPVLVSTSGKSLTENDFIRIFKKEILPASYILTPNIYEASILSDVDIKSIDDVKQACKIIYDFGSLNILIKGGHLKNDTSDDVFYNGRDFFIYSLPRITNKIAHGSGCTFSALITSFLTIGDELSIAIEKSKYVLWDLLNYSYKIGKGSDFLNIKNLDIVNNSHLDNSDFLKIWFDLRKCTSNLCKFIDKGLIAEVGMNFGYAISNASTPDDVCAVDGRIVASKKGCINLGSFAFGGSKHIASVILAAMSFDSSFRSALNIRYSDDLLLKCKKIGFKIGFFDRNNEPENICSTMEWGTSSVIKKLGFVPDIIYDKGDVGKEPMIRILGKNPDNVVFKLRKLYK